MQKAAEGTAALHDAGARFENPFVEMARSFARVLQFSLTLIVLSPDRSYALPGILMVPEIQTPDPSPQTSAPKLQTGPASHARNLWRDLRDALRGTTMDYTQGSIGRAILLLAVPMMLEMGMESTFAVVDIYFVSYLGSSAVATVGLTESVLTLVYAVAIGLSMGTTALVARRIGEKNPTEAANTAVQAILVAIGASIPVSIAGAFFAKDILALMGADAWSIAHGYRYTTW